MSVSFEELQLQRFDPDALLHAINNTMTEHSILGGGAVDAHLRRLELGGLTINCGDYGFPCLARGGFPRGDLVHVGMVMSAIDDVSVNNCKVLRGQLQLYAPGCELQYVTRSKAEWVIVALPLERLHSAAIAQWSGELEWPRSGVSYVDLPAEVANRLLREIRSLQQFGSSLADGADRRVAETLASEGLIQLFAHAIATHPHSSRPRTILSKGRRQALLALESHIQDWVENPDIGLSLAQVEHASTRMLELATREAYGVTPHKWLKLARLNAAHQDLLHGNCRFVSIACQRWGFNHMGRFAIEYRELFGESPRATLQRGK